MIGVDGSFGGEQQYYSLPNYQNPISSPTYIPLVQPDNFHHSSVDSLYDNSASVNRLDGRGSKHKFNSASAAFTKNSSKPSSNQTSSFLRVPEGPRANALAKKDSTNGSVPNSGFLNFASSPSHQVISLPFELYWNLNLSMSSQCWLADVLPSAKGSLSKEVCHGSAIAIGWNSVFIWKDFGLLPLITLCQATLLLLICLGNNYCTLTIF